MAKVSIVFEDVDGGGYCTKLVMEHDGVNKLTVAERQACMFWGLLTKIHSGLGTCETSVEKELAND